MNREGPLEIPFVHHKINFSMLDSGELARGVNPNVDLSYK